MNLVDTHCHLYLEEFDEDIHEVMQRAENDGVSKFYLPAIDSSYTTRIQQLEASFPGKCFAMTGLHPCSVKATYRQELELVEKSLSTRTFAAVGEVGLDFYWDRTFEAEQYEAFGVQVDWAKKYRLPVVIHSRQSITETIEQIRQRQDGSLTGIFHCFNDRLEIATQIIELGFYLGIGGVLTYKNSQLPDTLRHLSTRYLVLETDAPYLAPVPFRGKRNESSYLKYVLSKLAEIKNESVEEVARLTTENSTKIFGS